MGISEAINRIQESTATNWKFEKGRVWIWRPKNFIVEIHSDEDSKSFFVNIYSTRTGTNQLLKRGNMRGSINSVKEELEKEVQKFQKLLSATDTKTSSQEKLKVFYKGTSRLSPSTYHGEKSNRKFWLLTDGTIISCTYTHEATATRIGVDYSDLFKEGAFTGHISVRTHTLNLASVPGGSNQLTSEQRLSVLNLYKKYTISKVIIETPELPSPGYISSEVNSERELSNILIYMKPKRTIVNSAECILPRKVLGTDVGEAINRIQKETEWYKVFLTNEKETKSYPVYINLDQEHLRTYPGAKECEFKTVSDAEEAGWFVDYLIDESIFVPAVWLRIAQLLHESVCSSKKVNEDNMVDHARYELELAGLFDKESDYGGMLGEAVLELIEKFAAQSHSGFSAGLTTQLFNKLAGCKTLSELTNNPAEWMEVSEYSGELTWQSRRCPTCFSHDNGKTYYDLDDKANEGKDKKDWKFYSTKVHTTEKNLVTK